MSEPPFVERRAPNRDLEHSVTELANTVRDLRAQLVSKELYDSDKASAGALQVALGASQAAKVEATAEANRLTLQLISERIAAVKDGNDQTLTLVKELEKQRAADRRLVITSIIIPVLLLILGAYVAARLG